MRAVVVESRPQRGREVLCTSLDRPVTSHMAISGKRDTRALKPVSRRGEPVLKTRKNLWGRAPLTADRRRVALAYATYVPQASAGRSAHAAGAGPPRAARETRRACGLRLRPVVVGAVRDRGNSPGAHPGRQRRAQLLASRDRKSTRLNSSHVRISYAVFCLK